MNKIAKQRDRIGLTALFYLINSAPLDKRISPKDIWKVHCILNEFQKISEHRGSQNDHHGKVKIYKSTHRWKRGSCWRIGCDNSCFDRKTML